MRLLIRAPLSPLTKAQWDSPPRLWIGSRERDSCTQDWGTTLMVGALMILINRTLMGSTLMLMLLINGHDRNGKSLILILLINGAGP